MSDMYHVGTEKSGVAAGSVTIELGPMNLVRLERIVALVQELNEVTNENVQINISVRLSGGSAELREIIVRALELAGVPVELDTELPGAPAE